jgi:UDP-galactopyranose mutase
MRSLVVDTETGPPKTPIMCFSHLRWDFVFQRPQQLMGRFAKSRTVVFVEEPLFQDVAPNLHARIDSDSGVTVWTPQLPRGASENLQNSMAEQLLLKAMLQSGISLPILWYYTPLMRDLSRNIRSSAIVYDCMDELSNFRFAPPGMIEAEKALIADADIMFTGGVSLYEAKRHLHSNIHAFPSSVDKDHFAQARTPTLETPSDQASVQSPRFGYFGVLDERIDFELIAKIAEQRPHWSIVLVGPTAKLTAGELPQRANIHYLGIKPYAELPAYLHGWDVALMPFATNAATQFISPTKTPEYLSGGKPVVSTAIKDVERFYGHLDAVRISNTHEKFIADCEATLGLSSSPGAWMPAVDAALAGMSWDTTCEEMDALLTQEVNAKKDREADFVKNPAHRARYDFVIVGAGFAGSVMAERLASAGQRVLIIDRRPHIGGNAFDYYDEAGILVHKYGPHIFHTNSQDIWAYLSKFTAWRPYEHRVLADVDGKRVPIPINRTTLNQIFDLDLRTERDAEEFLKSRAQKIDDIRTSEDVVLATVGKELYEMFFRGYSEKQWGLDPSELDKSVTARIPTRYDTDDRYFTDRFQAMPELGYTEMFRKILDHPNISIALSTAFKDVETELGFDHLIYTGSIDEYYGFSEGKLPYRSIIFEHRTLERTEFQSVGTVNYPSARKAYTRITEFKHLTGQSNDKTSVVFEFPTSDGDPYYPIPRPENASLYKRYEALAAGEDSVTFIGRLATYRYYNMDQVVGQALASFRRLCESGRCVSSFATAAE